MTGGGVGAHEYVNGLQQLPTVAAKATYIRLEDVSHTPYSHWPLTAASKTGDSQRHCTFLFSFFLLPWFQFSFFCLLFYLSRFPS